MNRLYMLRVLPSDIDISKTTTDRYFALMELGRTDFAFRIDLLRTMLRNRWGSVITFCTISFRHPLKVFQKYQFRTSAAYWDDHILDAGVSLMSPEKPEIVT